MDKKKHRKHFDEKEDGSKNIKKQKKKEFEEEDLGFDDEENDLFIEVKKFLK